MGFLENELDRQKEENKLQHEQILTLQAKLQDTELRLHKVGTSCFSKLFNNKSKIVKKNCVIAYAIEVKLH